ncbi:hypothetical protein K435DRAFT_684472 [Dendrothele bispora CBS 962.96]|uniref:Galactose oxidase-like Early set domain-containing protein n=1 Tax=Dendrothele bispora (strain CBS 962.96) TaxID=1314807 RepID=A0A4V4HD77_DENBC|nr:hypothetical protein K435DRAFT_684472 [Dendrothele bispora CBS 962.96]
MEHTRPTYTGLPATFDYNSTITLNVDIDQAAQNVSVVIMDFGFTTHGVHIDQRSLTMTGPLPPTIYPLGPTYVFVLMDGVPSFGHKTLIGTGAQPPLDEGALNK